MKKSHVWLAVALVAIGTGIVWRVSTGDSDRNGEAEVIAPSRTSTRSAEADQRDQPTIRKSGRLRKEDVALLSHVDGRGNLENIWVEGTYENILVGCLLKEFDGERLRQLADSPQRDSREVSELILRAAAEKDRRFADLLLREDLRSETEADLAFHAYDFAINGNQDALREILSHDVAGDSSAGWVLGFVDEWDLTRDALQTGGFGGDGAGGDAQYSFWLKRRFLFPHTRGFPTSYEDFAAGLRNGQMLRLQRAKEQRTGS